MSDNVMEITDLVIELLPDTDGFTVLLVHQDPQFTHDRKHKMFSHPPSKLWVKDGRVLWIGQDHQTIIGELLVDQGLVAFTNMELTDVPFY